MNSLEMVRLVQADDKSLVRAYIKDGMKINAIKELRNIEGIGLKEAKDAVEAWADWYNAGMPNFWMGLPIAPVETKAPTVAEAVKLTQAHIEPVVNGFIVRVDWSDYTSTTHVALTMRAANRVVEDLIKNGKRQ